jgi:hypothetical protein
MTDFFGEVLGAIQRQYSENHGRRREGRSVRSALDGLGSGRFVTREGGRERFVGPSGDV